METEDAAWLADLEKDLRAKEDRSGSIDELFQLSFSGDEEKREKVSWCLAKMAQNKCQHMEIYMILMSMSSDDSPEILENIAWGLGEAAGSGIGDQNGLDLIKRLMRNGHSNVRSMAAWASGRYHHRLKLIDEDSESILNSLLEDSSELVRKSAEFAIDEEQSKEG